MLKLKELYELPFQPANLFDWVLRDDWFPEIDSLTSRLSRDVLEALTQEGRLEVRNLVHDYIDGSRFRSMVTVWFDGQPVFIVQNAGRGGDDWRNRWVTDAPRYWALVSYLLSMFAKLEQSDDFVDPDAEVYEEEVFLLYGEDVAERFGYQSEPRAKGYLLLHDGKNIVPGAPAGLHLVMLCNSVTEPAPFIRREACVMELRCALSAAELASNERLEAAAQEEGGARYFWYKPVKRPEDSVKVLSV